MGLTQQLLVGQPVHSWKSSRRRLAEDVTQGAFVALARSAHQLTERAVLSGWLHRTAQNIAAQTVRTDVRRGVREQEAAAMNELFATEPDGVWEHIAPHLDAALGELSEADRDALLLRYFERKSAQEMAQVLGVSDEAAQKRVSRAVERLREFFAKRGVTASASGLVVVISANAVQAAPVGLAVTISTAAALTSTSLVTTTTAIVTKAIVMTTLQKTLVAGVLAAAVGIGIFKIRQDSNSRGQGKTLLQQDATASGIVAAPANEMMTTASGLKYQMLQQGTGTVSPTATDTVNVHYHGMLLDGTVFDSSVERGRPFKFPLDTVIAGWTEGLQLMRVGDKFKFEIPPDLAYGAQSKPNIPPNSTLVFEVELLGIQ